MCRAHRLSSNQLFCHGTKSTVPEGGWNSETFATANGVALLRDLVRVRRVAMDRSMRSLSEFLKDRYLRMIDSLILSVFEAKERMGHRTDKGTKAAEFRFDPGSDPILWANALTRELAAMEVDLVIEMPPRYQSVATEVYGKVGILLGSRTTLQARQQILAGVRDLARKVTGIDETTQRRLALVIERGLANGDPVNLVARAIRDRFPSIMGYRIPTIARTEMGRAVDLGSSLAMQNSGVVLAVDVVGCQAIEPNIPTYNGVPTCNITKVPVRDASKLEFHINHTGCIVPSQFVPPIRAGIGG